MKKHGTMFEELDLEQSDNMLKAALVKIFVERGITFEKFSELHRNYMMASGVPLKKITSSRNNLLKVLLGSSTLTYARFAFIMKNILQLRCKNFQFEYRDIHNTDYVVSIDRITY